MKCRWMGSESQSSWVLLCENPCENSSPEPAEMSNDRQRYANMKFNNSKDLQSCEEVGKLGVSDSKSSGPCAHESSILSSGTRKIKGLADPVSPFFIARMRDCAPKLCPICDR
jgi:hypothetical protein